MGIFREEGLRVGKRSKLIEKMAAKLPSHSIRFRCQIVAVETNLITSFPIIFFGDGSIINTKWPYEAAAIAFEAIPRTLAQNSGVNVIQTMTAFQGKHANGENAWVGIDGNTGAMVKMHGLESTATLI